MFTISDMVVEPHDYPTGTVLGFNGTTEWALDSVAQEDALWLPREDQLRELLGRHVPQPRPVHRTAATRCSSRSRAGPEQVFSADEAADAYAQALLALVLAAADRV